MKQAAALVLASLGLAGCGSHKSPSVALVYVRGSSSIWTARADGSNPRQVATGAGPLLSPNGRWIAFARCGKDECDAAEVIPARGGSPVLVTHDAYPYVWTPDSRRLLAAVGHGKTETLVATEVATGKRVVLARGSFYGVDVSPSGEDVVYVSGPPGCSTGGDLYVVSIRGGKPRQLTHDGGDRFPVWGPNAIAFARNTGPCYPPAYRTWRIDPDGTNAKLLTNGLVGAKSHEQGWWGWVPVAWSADGRRLLAARTSEFYDEPYAIDPERATFRRIDAAQRNFYTFDLSRDGTLVLLEGDKCFEGCSQVVTLLYDGGALRVLAAKGESPSWNR
jgi:Tol biopolymer transport system component